MKLRSDTGIEVDSGGKPRVVHRRDGWYVVRRGMLAPVGSPEAGAKLIQKLRGGGSDAPRMQQRAQQDRAVTPAAADASLSAQPPP